MAFSSTLCGQNGKSKKGDGWTLVILWVSTYIMYKNESWILHNNGPLNFSQSKLFDFRSGSSDLQDLIANC